MPKIYSGFYGTLCCLCLKFLVVLMGGDFEPHCLVPVHRVAKVRPMGHGSEAIGSQNCCHRVTVVRP